MGPNVPLLRRPRSTRVGRAAQRPGARRHAQLTPGGGRRRQASGPVAALVLLAFEGLMALAGVQIALLSAVVLALAPGLALLPTLPAELGRVGRAVAVPLTGMAAASIALIGASALGVPLTGLSVRLVLAAIAAAGLAVALLTEPAPAEAEERSSVSLALGLGAALCLGLGLQAQVIGGTPVPGTDWGHYLLYPTEIARQHGLLIDNPLWMLGGEPFRDDPGVASLYGTFLLMSGAEPATLAHGIWLFAALAGASAFVLAYSLWGRIAGVVAAAVVVTVPMNLTILGWHGLSNIYGLCLLPLALVAVGWGIRGHGHWRMSWLLALSLAGLAAAHRLTLLVALLALAGVAVGSLAFREERDRLLRFALRSGAFALPLGLLLLLDAFPRSRGAGGVQDHEVYLSTKIDLGLAFDELTIPIVVAAGAALAWVAYRARRDRSLLVVLGLFAGVAVLAYGWIFHLPAVYYRAVYFLPLLAGVAIGIGVAALARRPLPRARRMPALLAAVVALGLIGATAGVADERAPGVRNYYGWASESSLRGLAMVSDRTQAGDPVVTDRCWSFLAEWLLHRPVLAGLDPADILPGWEARPARQARTILYGPATAARRTAARHGIRYAVLNPGCSSDEADGPRLPNTGAPIYESTRLVVLDLAAGRAGR